ncbi:MAG TPA: (d)CMP kinase [Thermohalobaculum sp.]|nr:(d)CMP kinase [Thermohalobaculum sp.]
MRFVVAIDGPAAAGKGTIARSVAARFGFAHLDTGLLYRAVGKRALDQGNGVLDEGVATLIAAELTPDDLEAEDLRGDLIARAASKVAAIPEVRQALLDFQRRFAAREGGAVLDGRDIGTVICPDAEVKLFVIADDQTRAQRRHSELAKRGEDTTVDQVLADLRSRDARDAGRADAPTRRAEDAHLLDTTELVIDAAVDKAAQIIEQALKRARKRKPG